MLGRTPLVRAPDPGRAGKGTGPAGQLRHHRVAAGRAGIETSLRCP